MRSSKIQMELIYSLPVLSYIPSWLKIGSFKNILEKEIFFFFCSINTYLWINEFLWSIKAHSLFLPMWTQSF